MEAELSAILRSWRPFGAGFVECRKKGMILLRSKYTGGMGVEVRGLGWKMRAQMPKCW